MASNCRQLVGYWLSLASEGSIPCKRQINPQDISSILPNIFILGAGDDGTFSFRLVGTALGDARNEDFTGADFLQRQSPGLRKVYGTVLAAAMKASCGVVLGRTLQLSDLRQLRLLHVALPLLDQDGHARFIVGATDVISNRPIWGTSEVAAHVSARMIKCRYLDLGWGLPDEEEPPFRKYARGA